MGKLIPYIQSEDARAQAAFYKQALGGEIASMATHEQLMGAQNEFKDKVMLCALLPMEEAPSSWPTRSSRSLRGTACC